MLLVQDYFQFLEMFFAPLLILLGKAETNIGLVKLSIGCDIYTMQT